MVYMLDGELNPIGQQRIYANPRYTLKYVSDWMYKNIFVKNLIENENFKDLMVKRKLKITFTGDEISENNAYYNEKKMIVTIVSKEEDLNNQI